ncbi:MAG TPA: Rid family detoxifying hydrolase [Chitinophagales bacterium]|nr:Rid family detoxifying hydrolase [Chitinophagales bacterium]
MSIAYLCCQHKQQQPNSELKNNNNNMFEKQIINTPNAPAAIGPYSQAVWAGNTLYLSGQIALDPQTSQLIVTEGIATETRRVMDNIAAVLQAANLTWANVVKATIFLTTMDNYATVNTVYGSYFEGITPPAREAVAVAALPRQVNVEISIIAAIK